MSIYRGTERAQHLTANDVRSLRTGLSILYYTCTVYISRLASLWRFV